MKEDYNLHRQPLRGDIVTFSHDSQTRNATPTNPVVYRIRADLTWMDVIKSSKEPVRQFLNGIYHMLVVIIAMIGQECYILIVIYYFRTPPKYATLYSQTEGLLEL